MGMSLPFDSRVTDAHKGIFVALVDWYLLIYDSYEVMF